MSGLLQRWRRPPESALTLSRFVDTLKQGNDPSHEEIAFILRERALAVPRLHAILEDASHWQQLPDESWNAQIHALFLLAALEAPEGLAPTLRLLRKPPEFVDDFFGDLLTECLSWALARLAKTDSDALKVLAGDQTLDPYLRSAADRGLMAQALVWMGGVLGQAIADLAPPLLRFTPRSELRITATRFTGTLARGSSFQAVKAARFLCLPRPPWAPPALLRVVSVAS